MYPYLCNLPYGTEQILLSPCPTAYLLKIAAAGKKKKKHAIDGVFFFYGRMTPLVLDLFPAVRHETYTNAYSFIIDQSAVCNFCSCDDTVERLQRHCPTFNTLLCALEATLSSLDMKLLSQAIIVQCPIWIHAWTTSRSQFHLFKATGLCECSWTITTVCSVWLG